MELTSIWNALSLVATAGFIWLVLRYRNQERQIGELKRNLGQLGSISALFPKFLERSEDLTRNWAEEMDWRQTALKNLIREADQSLSRLDHLQNELKDSQISKTTIEEILILINQGFEVEEIARRMNLPQGEVDVAVRLRQYLNDPMAEKL